MNYHIELKKLARRYGDDPITQGCYEAVSQVFLSYVQDLNHFIDNLAKEHARK